MRERHLRIMHVHFVRGVWRWLLGDDWEAEAHFKFAVLKLEEDALDDLLDANGAAHG